MSIQTIAIICALLVLTGIAATAWKAFEVRDRKGPSWGILYLIGGLMYTLTQGFMFFILILASQGGWEIG